MSHTIGSLNGLRIFVARSSSDSITCDTIRKRSKACAIPFFGIVREIARWAAKYDLEQTCEAALDAFRTMPDEDNLPVISLIWKKFPLGRGDGDEIFHIDVIRTLCAHKYALTVPLLAPLVTDGWT